MSEVERTAVAALIYDAVSEVYPRVSADHDPERGHDGYTFGTLIWRELEHEVRVRGLMSPQRPNFSELATEEPVLEDVEPASEPGDTGQQPRI